MNSGYWDYDQWKFNKIFTLEKNNDKRNETTNN